MTRRPDHGFILVSVLGVLAVLAGLVGAVSYLVRTTVLSAASLRDDLVADALTHSGVELAGYQLFMLRRPPRDVNAQQIRLNDGVVTLFVSPEDGKVDVNGAAADLLAGIWRASGATGLTPESFAARVIDYRDADDERQKGGGAEGADYAAAGPNRRPANAPFEQVDDLQNVLGVTPADVRRLTSLLTVHNPSGKVSALTAPAAVLRALPGVAGPTVDRALALRARGGADVEAQLKETLGPQEQFVSFGEAAAFAVRIEVRRGAAVRSVRTVLTRSRAQDALYFVTEWDDRAPR